MMIEHVQFSPAFQSTDILAEYHVPGSLNSSYVILDYNDLEGDSSVLNSSNTAEKGTDTCILAFLENHFEQSREFLRKSWNPIKNFINKLRPSKQDSQPDAIAHLAVYDLETINKQELDIDWKLSSYFREIKVITSNEQSPRFQRCLEELENVGVKSGEYIIFPGVDGTKIDPSIWMRAINWDDNDTEKQKQGRMGCFMAHYNAIKDSKDRLQIAQKVLKQLKMQEDADLEIIKQVEEEIDRCSNVLIIEDNTGFGRVTGDQTATLEGMGKKLRETLKELPKDWDMFYFMTMADDWGPSKQVSPCLLKLNYGVLTKCYAVNAKMYATILEHFDTMLNAECSIPPVDHVLAILHSKTNCYAAKGEGLTYRFGSVSEVQGLDQSVEIKNWQPCITKIY
jgi:hypothetical protein